MAKTKTINDVLMAEAIELKVHDFLKGKFHDRMFIQNIISRFVCFGCIVPRVHKHAAWGSPMQAETYDLRVVETRNATEPREQFATARNSSVDCISIFHATNERGFCGLVKRTLF